MERAYRGGNKAKSKKEKVLAAAAAATAAAEAAAADSAGTAPAAAEEEKKAKRQRKTANGVDSSSIAAEQQQKKRKVHKQQHKQQEEEGEEEEQQQEQQHDDQQENHTADEDEGSEAEVEQQQQQQRQQRQRQQQQQQQQQQLKLPDWTDRYVLVPDEAADSEEASAALLQQLHPAAAAAFRRLIGSTFFPIQLAVIPHLLRLLELPFGSPEASDVCVHAATGEGKTLCYALPLISHLFKSVVPRLRCVVLTPTRELALQVGFVFNLIAGDRDRDRDREGDDPGGDDPGGDDPGGDDPRGDVPRSLKVVCLAGETAAAKRHNPAAETAAAEAAADVIVCTPGRFVDAAQVYIQCKKRGIKGRGPSFEALQWLVLDEADRLLRQSYHGWLDVSRLLATLRGEGGKGEEFNSLMQVPPVRKILVSATMTRNPKALHDLQLYKPLFFFCSPTGSSLTPAQLQQKYVLCRPENKPLVLIALLYQLANAAAAEAEAAAAAKEEEKNTNKHGGLRVVVFCGSRAAAHRLSRLLQLHFLSDKRRLMEFVPPFDADATPDSSSSNNNNDNSSNSSSSNDDSSSSSSSNDNSSSSSSSNRYPRGISEFSASLSQRDRHRLLKNFKSVINPKP
ncbi:helicase, putative [Eimeria maxima]|uniref:ATP-dependent RNA helicase n=1 Tax=Eimeria maxima TaxID=5804 RepID=U6M227_EIMMA|nr:helicase, putative [Eimeria maxima]CDJ58046.1 helicase, putative [Eimeria maxima]